MNPMWTIALIVVVGALAVGLNVTLVIEKLKGDLDGTTREAEEPNHIDRLTKVNH